MRIGRRWVTGLAAALLLLPVPAFAIQKSLAKAGAQRTTKQHGSKATEVAIQKSPAKAGGQVRIQQRGSGTPEVVFHQREERRTFHEIARSLRAQFRGSSPLERRSINRFLRDLRAALQQHWRAERRTGVVSPFVFPEL
jgi:hypothetical protein